MSMCGTTTPCDTISLVSKETVDHDNEENLPELPTQSDSFKKKSKPVARAVTFKFPPLPEEVTNTDGSDEEFEEKKAAVYSKVLKKSLRRKNTLSGEEAKSGDAAASEQTSGISEDVQNQSEECEGENKSPRLLTTDL